MWFWVKHLSLAVILIVAAIYFLFGRGPIMDMKETKNAAAQGLSRFYSALRNQVNKSNERDKYVLKLPKPELNIDAALIERARVVEPSSPNWTGEFIPRRFKNGSTLKKTMSEYAHNEDIVLYWYLSKDYVVKDHFRVDSNFNSTLYQVGRAINDDFENEVYTFFCFKQRAAVITELPSEYVRENCRRLKS
ncbi:toxin co-regulated pilus biosynthesis Q family protein [Pseudoalteromonas shioyasakiensis]|uniref:TcpQ domain-containing protein n=1 Tax=Pseudoalteromonas shioyasakiensis TaxID=1190813 RepID=UPI0021175F17|nr:TcpQ domain-containing protein [Pseudoalteromonas shioyasakiensis]MCQ8878129.1 toxin co-regulated pilus biosynthesis Q family protein [Pseudoalteromonas shioyasakiensis]